MSLSNSESDQKTRAIKHLIDLWRTKCNLKREQHQAIGNNCAHIENEETARVNKMEMLLRQKEIELQISADNDADHVEDKLNEYARSKRHESHQILVRPENVGQRTVRAIVDNEFGSHHTSECRESILLTGLHFESATQFVGIGHSRKYSSSQVE